MCPKEKTREMKNSISRNIYEYSFHKIYIFLMYRSPSGKMYRVMIEKIWSNKPLVQILSLDYGWRQICDLRDVKLLPDEPFRLASEYSTRLAQRVYLGNCQF